MSRETVVADEILASPHIPLDKSQMIRMGVLDLRHGQTDTLHMLRQQPTLSDDLIALREASEVWPGDEPVPVRESATLLRTLKFLSWEEELDKDFITAGTLVNRPITEDPSIIGLSQRELLRLDHGTSQWASAAVLCGDPERLETAPFKLRQTYDAVDNWQRQQNEGIPWLPERDRTIELQADAFRKMLIGDIPSFHAIHAEDYCFAVEFGYISPEEAERRWPSLRGHESDRIAEMAVAMDQAGNGEVVESLDHRVVQAIAMWGRVMDREVDFAYPWAVNKSWPQFWSFLRDIV